MASGVAHRQDLNGRLPFRKRTGSRASRQAASGRPSERGRLANAAAACHRRRRLCTQNVIPTMNSAWFCWLASTLGRLKCCDVQRV